MTAYYNEIEPYAAAWLRNLIAAGHIAPGEVDERDIRDISPYDLRGFTQCHFFAGIGVWSLALRRAGWADDRPVWTGSCPCQPFSAAGRGVGFADERHLWPHWFHLIGQCRPAVVLGEQVASKDTGPWLDLVQDDLEDLGYAFGAVPFPAAGVGAPHIRDRLYWLADSSSPGRRSERQDCDTANSYEAFRARAAESGRRGAACILGDAGGAGLEGRHAGALGYERKAADRTGALGGVADAASPGWGRERQDSDATYVDEALRAGAPQSGRRGAVGHNRPAGPTNGLWGDADWLLCRDGKWRPVEPGTFPLAYGVASRVGKLRAAGNAIVAPAAEAFVRSYLDGESARLAVTSVSNDVDYSRLL